MLTRSETSKIRFIIKGSIARTIPSIIERSAERLCLTTWTSSVQLSFGSHKLIRSPPKERVMFKRIGMKQMVANCAKVSGKTKSKRREESKIIGETKNMFKLAFAKNKVFSLIGVEDKIQMFFPSRENEEQLISVKADKLQNIIGSIDVKLSVESDDSPKIEPSPSGPMNNVPTPTATIKSGPMIVFIR